MHLSRSSSEAALPGQDRELEARIHAIGSDIFSRMQGASLRLFSKAGLYGQLMHWSMRDEAFKVQLFRFVDVLPTLRRPRLITGHLREYLEGGRFKLPWWMAIGLRVADTFSPLSAPVIRWSVQGMAQQFISGSNDASLLKTLRRRHRKGIAFTVDVLGETVVSEKESVAMAERYRHLLETLDRETKRWAEPTGSNVTPQGPLPRVHVSIKISALCPQILATDPDASLAKLKARLRPLLLQARDLDAAVTFDMEHYGLKDLTLRLFQELLEEEAFASYPHAGIALQAYLRDCENDLKALIAWGRRCKRHVTVRLVKGAYWDYETIMAAQRGWAVPVFCQKPESDANYEKLSLLLLENADVISAAFGTHNVRSIAYALAQADRLGVDRRAFEFQMLYGMAEPIKEALINQNLRVREYAPVGELLPGMAYLVRRLLENTSNEGFLRARFADGASVDRLLQNPLELISKVG